MGVYPQSVWHIRGTNEAIGNDSRNLWLLVFILHHHDTGMCHPYRLDPVDCNRLLSDHLWQLPHQNVLARLQGEFGWQDSLDSSSAAVLGSVIPSAHLQAVLLQARVRREGNSNFLILSTRNIPA